MSTDTIRALLLTDVVDSTKQSEEIGDAAMAEVWMAHDRVARDLLVPWRGREIDKTDGMLLMFANASDAVNYAFAYHEALAALPSGIKARAGLHVGPVILRENLPADIVRGAKPLEVEGMAKPTAARVMSIARGGQTLLTSQAREDLGETSLTVESYGHWMLKGVSDPLELFEVGNVATRFDAPGDGEKAYRVVREGDWWRPVRNIPNNLPHQRTSFIGRRKELDDIKALLDTARLVTVLGMGGLGKTRLCLQAAAETLGNFPEGAWLVELAPLSDGRLVAQAVASALGVKEEAGRPVQEALAKYVKDRRLLLILDNCEHLLDACAALVAPLLQSGPGLTVLASSREPLREAGEATYQVPTLPVPDADTITPLADLTQCVSVRLFADRAVAMLPGFKVTDVNAVAVTAICRRLEGIPLALELAAARVRSLPVEKIAERLDDRFHVLTRGNRTALPRQQTLRACIDWSYNLLPQKERALLRRLAVFTGGFALEAAELVGAGGEIGASEVLDLLTQLVDKSLVELAAHGQRYRLLETVRHYAHELLNAAGETDETRTRHLQYCLALADQADGQLHGPEQGGWLARLDVERENLLAAHAWCGAADERAEAGLRLAFGVQLYWMRRGILHLGYRVTVEALERPGASARTRTRCRALYAAGNLGRALARYGEARAYVEESLAIARAIGDKNRLAAALVLLGTIFNDQGDRAAARRCYEESLSLSEELGDPLRLSNVLGSLAILHGSDGEFDVAETLFEKSLALSRSQGNPNNVAANLCNLAIVSSRRGVPERARARLFEALTIAESNGSKSLGLAILGIASVVAATGGEWAHAVRHYGASQAESRRQGFDANREDEVLGPLIARARIALGNESFIAEENAGLARDYDDAMADVRAWLAAAR